MPGITALKNSAALVMRILRAQRKPTLVLAKSFHFNVETARTMARFIVKISSFCAKAHAHLVFHSCLLY